MGYSLRHLIFFLFFNVLSALCLLTQVENCLKNFCLLYKLCFLESNGFVYDLLVCNIELNSSEAPKPPQECCAVMGYLSIGFEVRSVRGSLL